MSVRGAAFIGIGSMVGAGIFALLGEAALFAGPAVWLSFLLAGVVTMLLAYNVVKLGIRYPSEGGLIEYLRQGFGNGRLLGVAAWLGYAAAFVVVAAMLAVSFGSYATTLIVGDDAWSGWDNLFASLLLVVMTVVNMTGATLVSRVASVMVVVLLAVFAVFIWVTVSDVDLDLLAFSGYPSFSKIVASIALTFFAFLGFGVMTFTVASLRDPARELPRAVALALGLTTALYVLIAIGVFGTLTVDEAIGYGETAIAEAARPTLGDAGFTLMAVAALIATAGATNGTLFGAGGLTASLAEMGQFPPLLGRDSRLGKHGGLIVTGIVALVRRRALSVVAKGFNMHGDPVVIEGSEMLARAIQHETDHLDGVLFIDRLDREARRAAMKAIREADWFGAPPTVKVSPHATNGLGL